MRNCLNGAEEKPKFTLFVAWMKMINEGVELAEVVRPSEPVQRRG